MVTPEERPTKRRKWKFIVFNKLGLVRAARRLGDVL